MKYKDALDYILSASMFCSKLGLERISTLLCHLGNPQNKLKFIHIAGTNGKGSTANAAAFVLKEAGFKTGLYTSPFIIDFRERIQINGEMISQINFSEEVEKITPFVEKMKEDGIVLTEFELITAIALCFFEKEHCDIVVLEVGLGGRFDSTNIIEKPLVSVITSISYDHTAILGDTLEKIAFEKCGIIKERTTVVTSPGQKIEVLETIMKICAQRNCKLIIPNVNAVNVLNEGFEGTDINYGGVSLHIPLPGKHQINNFITAIESLKVIRNYGFDISEKQISVGMAKVKFPARLEVMSKSPLIVIDGAHNPGGLTVLASYIKDYLKSPPILIIGMLADKDYKTSLSIVSSISKAVITLKPNNKRALEATKLALIARDFCKQVFSFESYSEALVKAVDLSHGAPVVICGSLYLASEMRKKVIEYLKISNK